MKKVIIFSTLFIFLLFFIERVRAQKINKNQTGYYEIKFQLGENKISGSIELLFNNKFHQGRLSVQLPVTLNVSLHEVSFENNNMLFRTSSPVLGASIDFSNSKDSIAGVMDLPGGRSFSFTGMMKKTTVDSSFEKEILGKSHWVGSDSLGFAFPTLSPEGNLLVFSAYYKDFSNQKLMYKTLNAGQWSESKVLSFSGQYSDRAPSFSPDGTLYFSSRRTIEPNGLEKKDYDIWHVKYKGNGDWSKPQLVEEINSGSNDYQPSITNEGIYFTSDREGGLGGQDIYFAAGRKNKYMPAVNLGDHINSEQDEMSAYVSPGGDIMILATGGSNLKSYGNDDLYIVRKVKGKWQLLENLGSGINSFANEYGASLTPDQEWLIYTSDVNPRAKIYKVKWGR